MYVSFQSADELREHIAVIALNEPYMGEKIPIRWLQFEGSLAEMASSELHYVSFTQVEMLFLMKHRKNVLILKAYTKGP